MKKWMVPLLTLPLLAFSPLPALSEEAPKVETQKAGKKSAKQKVKKVTAAAPKAADAAETAPATAGPAESSENRSSQAGKRVRRSGLRKSRPLGATSPASFGNGTADLKGNPNPSILPGTKHGKEPKK